MDALLLIARGIPLTVLVTAASFAIGALVAIPLTAGLDSGLWWIRLPVRMVVDIVRAVPILVWLFLLYFGISIGGSTLDELQAAILTLGGVTSAYLAEVYRTAIGSIPAGQWDSAHALGLGRIDTLARVIAPQAIPIALPSATTFALTLLKDSSIPSVIGLTDVTFRTVSEVREQGDGLTPFIAALVIYLLLSVPVALVSRVTDQLLRKRAV